MATTIGVVVFPGTNCEHDAVAAVEQFVANKAHTVDPKVAQWPAVVAELVILTNVAIFLHVVTVFAVCTETVANQAYVV